VKGSAQRPGGSWLHQNYDKLALVLALVALLASAAILVIRVGTQRRLFDERLGREAGVVGRPAQPLDLTTVTQALARIEAPFQAQAEGRRFLVGDLRVASIPDGAPIPFAATRDPFSGKEQPPVDYDPDSDGDGIPDKFETKWGLNPFDPTDANSDLDGDGYSNVEEHQAGTDPVDRESFPPPSAKLRLVRTVTDPFRFIFVGISGERFQLNTRAGDRTYFVALGDDVEGFNVASYDAAAPGGPTLVLKRGAQTFKLVRGRTITDESRTAFLVFLLDGSRYRVRLNDTITLKDIRYKVVDIREDRIVIRDTTNDKVSTVVLISPEERSRLSGGGASALETPPSGL
jgi:hypothetical protein